MGISRKVKKMKVRNAVLVAVTLCSIVLVGVALADLSEVSAPTFGVGESWEYKDSFGTYTRTIKEILLDGSTRYTQSNEPRAVFTVDKNLTRTAVDGTVADVRGIGFQILDFPMTIGKSFTYNVNADNGTPFIIKVTAKKVETLKVKGGSFETVVLESCWKNVATGWNDCGMKHWYAPGVKALIKRKTPSDWANQLKDRDYELFGYTPAP